MSPQCLKDEGGSGIGKNCFDHDPRNIDPHPPKGHVWGGGGVMTTVLKPKYPHVHFVQGIQ